MVIIFLCIAFIICLLYYIKPAFKHEKEGIKGIEVELPYTDCPNMLLEKDGKYYLFNKRAYYPWAP